MIQALYIDPQGPYPTLLGAASCWDVTRDASGYDGPDPVIAHPPCGPWGRLRHLYKGDEHRLAPLAIEQVRRWGGVLEHPYGSKLWGLLREEYDRLPKPGADADPWRGFTVEVCQVEWGHVAQKRTWLYIVGADRDAVEALIAARPFPGRQPTHHVSRCAERARRRGYTLKRTSSKQNRLTPPAFAEFLIAVACLCAVPAEATKETA